MTPRTAPPRLRRAPTGADLVLLGALVAAVPLSRAAVHDGAAGSRLEIQGAETRVWGDLRHDADHVIRGPAGTTVVRVRDGAAWIAAAPCTNRLCVRMGRLRGPGRALVCLPNHVVVRVVGRRADVDAIAR